MKVSQTYKTVIANLPSTATGSAQFSAAMATEGAGDLVVEFTPINITSTGVSALELWGCETSGGSYALITGSGFTTLPTSSDDGKVWAWHVASAGNVPKFLKVKYTGVSADTFSISARLFGLPVSPNNASTFGVSAYLDIYQ